MKLPTVLSLSLLFSLLNPSPVAGTTTHSPGTQPFAVVPPEIFGIPSHHLSDASIKIGNIKQRYCFLFLKQGKIIHEKYYHNTSNTTYETDSAAKTMMGLLVGAVWTHRPWDLDQPLSQFGVNMSIFNHWKDVVTTRHILAQASGKGQLPPGVSMNYDSDAYIQKLSPLMGKILQPDNITVIDWAEKNFATPLGIGGVFYNNDAYIGGGNVSIGGGQRMTCRQMARVGQLMLNVGKWSTTNNSITTDIVIVDPAFVQEMKQPSFPNSVTTYGFLTWLNKRGTAPGFCCAPRWCADFPYQVHSHSTVVVLGCCILTSLHPYFIFSFLGWQCHWGLRRHLPQWHHWR